MKKYYIYPKSEIAVDVYEYDDLAKLTEEKCYRHIFVSFNTALSKAAIEEIIYVLQLKKLMPVFVGPELFDSIGNGTMVSYSRRKEILFLIQAESLLGEHGHIAKEKAERYLASGIISFVGSRSGEKLEEADSCIRRLIGQNGRENILVENATKLMAGQIIACPQVKAIAEVKKSFWEYVFGKKSY